MNHSDNNPFRIYVADLNAYNAGRLIGGWLKVSDYSDEEELGRAISDQLADPAHEHAIHDSEGVRVSEHVSTTRLVVLGKACAHWGCEKVQAAIDSGVDPDSGSFSDDIGERDCGEFESPSAWAEDYISSCYDLDKSMGPLARYFDYDSFARDAELGGDVDFIKLVNGNVWVLRQV